MKNKKLINRILRFIIPFLLIILTAGEILCGRFCSNILHKEIDQKIDYKMDNINSELKYNITNIVVIAETISEFVSKTYQVTPADQFTKLLAEEISQSDFIRGGGVFFESNIYNSKVKYFAPYVYKNGSGFKAIEKYSTEEYNYFQYDWYKKAIAMNKGSYLFNKLNYEEDLNAYTAKFSVPIYSNNKAIGVVIVDIDIDAVNEYANSIKVGNSGKVCVVSDEGLYLTNEDSEKRLKKSITDKSEGYGKIANKIITATKSGNVENDKYTYYYQKFEGIDWTIIIKMPNSEINKDINTLIWFFVIFSVTIIILLTMIIIYFIKKIVKEIIEIEDFTSKLSKGDFSIDKMENDTNDEIGKMCNSLNDMLVNNKEIIQNIADHSSSIDSSTDTLKEAAIELKENYKTIEKLISDINEDMINSSATTEEVNASAEEVDSATTLLSQETDKSSELVSKIKVKANGIQKSSKESYDNAIELSKKYEDNLSGSIENAKIISAINGMAETISGIAEQISLLSLNASIEAARAGENGRGFAVVAEEIGNLASETATSVNDIKNTIGQVQGVIEDLTSDSSDIINFIKETVTPDYNKFINIAKEYESDTIKFEEIFNNIANMSKDIKEVMDGVSNAIVEIAESAQATAKNSQLIIDNVNNLSDSVDKVSGEVDEEQKIVKELNGIVSMFKLK